MFELSLKVGVLRGKSSMRGMALSVSGLFYGVALSLTIAKSKDLWLDRRIFLAVLLPGVRVCPIVTERVIGTTVLSWPTVALTGQ